MEQGNQGEFPRTTTVLRWVGRLLCAADGHNLLTCFEPDRICLVCASCGYRSRGWEVGPRWRTAHPFTGESRTIERGQLTAHRQVA
jgi:hypothetical protein